MSPATETHASGDGAPPASQLHGYRERAGAPTVAGLAAPLFPVLVIGTDAVVFILASLFGFVIILGFIAVGAVLWYSRRNMEYQIDVTDDGVEVDGTAPLSVHSTHTFIPLEDIQQVEYTDSYAQYEKATDMDAYHPSERGDPDGRFHASRTYNLGVDSDWLKHGTVAGCVRIERDGEWPVYLGADRYEELAATIAAKAPHVENATECDYDYEEVLP